MNTTHLLVAVCIGVITMIVSAIALRQHSTFGGASIPIGICSGLLTLVGILDLGKSWSSGLLLPWVALGIALTVMMLFRFLSSLWSRIGRTDEDSYNHPGKKWKKLKKYSSNTSGATTNEFNPPIGALQSSRSESIPSSLSGNTIRRR